MQNKLLVVTIFLILLLSIFSMVTMPIRAAEWHVYPGQSIQEAINAASPGDTIIIHSGTYTEGPQILINKNLTITGTEVSTTIIKPAGDTGSVGDARGWFLVNPDVALNLSNLTLDGAGHYIYQAIRHKGQSTITNCIFKNIAYPSYQGFAIATLGNIDVFSCTFLNIGRVGVLYFGTVVTDSEFSGNSYTGKGDGDWLDYGVEVGAGAHVVISGNIISGCTGIASVDNSTSAGVLVTTYYGAGSLATIVNNDISGCTYGIAVGYDEADTSSVVAYMNNLYNNDWGIDSTAPAVDARFNWWGDASGPYHNVTNPSGLGNDVGDYIDYSPWLGATFQTTPRTYHVNPTGTIQEAIDEASPGDTVTVHPGTYNEQVVISKSLTLQGMGGTTIVKPSSAAKLTTVLSGHFWGGTKQIAGIIVANVAAGSSVTVKNLKVDGESVTAKPAGADYVAGIFYRETGGTIDSVTVTGITVGTTGTAVRGYGIYLSAIANAVSVEVKVSTITNYDKNGIDAHGNKLTVNIHHNTVTGRGPLPSGDEVQNGILIMDGATGTVNTNTISNMAYIPETWWSAGIMFLDSAGSAVSNIITDCQIGIIFQDGSGSAQGNTVTGGTVGLLGIWAQYTKSGTWTATFVGNTISGARDSLGYENGAIGAQCWNEGALITLTIDNNQIIGDWSTSADGIYIGDIPEYEPAGNITATITNNVISGWQHGIRLVSSVTDATITGNTIKNNLGTDSGIHIEPAVTVNNIHINYNNIFGKNATGVYGIFNNGIGTLDARYNWWGHPTGPYHPELNPSGKGDKISNYVDFEPWLLEPYPPVTPVETRLYIDPEKVEYWTPSYNSVFKVDLKIANVTNLTCYEFKLYWNTTLLDFDYAYIVEIWPLQIKIEAIDESLGRYWLAVSAQGEQSFTGSATLVELYFKVKYDPIYPNNVYSLLNLNETVLGDTSEPTPQPIPHMVHDGEYWCYSTKPKMKVEPSISTTKKLGETFNVNITVHDIVDLYDFEFWLHYNTTLLDVYAPYVQLGPLMSGATIYVFEWNDVLGYVHFAAKLTGPAPPVNGSGTIAIVTFKVTFASIWPEPDLECALSLDSTKLETIGGIEVPHDKINGLYRYKPIIGDLNTDGTVDLDDFYIIALAFGSKPGDSNWNKYADLDRNGVVNVLDLRTAARHFGEDC